MMTNRRKFIKQVTAAGIAGTMPTIILSREKSQGQIQLLVRGDDMANDWCRTLGMIKSYKEGIQGSAGIMVPGQYFEESVRLCKANQSLAVGIHVTIVATRTRPVLSPEMIPSLVTPIGFFYENVAELANANPSYEEMEKEIRAQVGKARASGLHFVYIDWHRSGSPENFVHQMRKEIVVKLCREKRLIFGSDWDGEMNGFIRTPLMRERFPSEILPDGSRAFFSGPPMTQEEKQFFFDNLNNLQSGQWLGLAHPGIADPNRADVTNLLCSQQAKEIIRRKNIQLVNFSDLWEKEFG